MFKILSLEFYSHPFFGSTIIPFVESQEIGNNHYISFIIGPNGTGKSKIFLTLINIINSIQGWQRQRRFNFDFAFKLKYVSNGNLHELYFNGETIYFDYVVLDFFSEDLELPDKTLISCFSFNDKYPLREQRGKVLNDKYHYLGLKSASNNIFISNPTKNAIGNLYHAILKNKDIEPLREAFTILELAPRMTLVYKTGKYFKFLTHFARSSSDMSNRDFADLFRAVVDERRRTSFQPELKRLGNEKIDNFFGFEENVSDLRHYLDQHLNELTQVYKREIGLMPVLDLESEHTFANFTSHVSPLQALSDLEIISFQRFEIKKQRENFSFDDASSGEYHIILTFLNILSLMDDRSLVLIDEPEISLHPNWQIRYMDIFNRIFSKFPGCHFIIASHSHFLVSDLQHRHSSIIAVTNSENGAIQARMLDANTYGWSAEQILLDIFNVATTRNYYLTAIVGNILKELAHIDPDLAKVRSDIQNLRRLDISNLNENDPLKAVIVKLINKTNPV